MNSSPVPEIRQQRLEALKMEIKNGLDSLNTGEGVETTDGLFENIKRQGRARFQGWKL